MLGSSKACVGSLGLCEAGGVGGSVLAMLVLLVLLVRIWEWGTSNGDVILSAGLVLRFCASPRRQHFNVPHVAAGLHNLPS